VQIAGYEVLSGLRERGFDYDVVEGHRSGEPGNRRVAAELVRHLLEPFEDLSEAPCQLGLDRVEPRGDGAVADPTRLVHEAIEENGVARLVDLLGREKVLLLLRRRRVDVGREAVGHRILSPEEEGIVPERRPTLEVGELLLPLAAVLGEVDLGCPPVAALPARVEVRVADRIGGGCHAHTPGDFGTFVLF
jgi:hypothetical protein